METVAHYPLFLDLRGRDVLVVGAGQVAARKVEGLLDAGARVRVAGARIDARLRAAIAQARVRHVARSFDPALLDGCSFVIAATDDPRVNAQVSAAATARGLWVNVVDDAARSSAILPAVVRRGPLTIAIGTGGVAPALAARLRGEIERVLDAGWGGVAELARRFRTAIRHRYRDPATRRRYYHWLLDGPVAAAIRAARPAAAEASLGRALRAGVVPTAGSVALVGAGPGDPGLLTLHALRRLQSADVVLHDHLVPEGVLALARRDAERIAVGKEAGGHCVAQARINDLMVERARAGHRVVRLKGGDPFVFGRGGEEIAWLRANAIDYEVVPGITAALGCAAYAGIPLTHRDLAQSVELVTAHCKDSLDTLDWTRLARARHTVVFYMGVARAGALQAALLQHGRARSTPVAWIENGTRPDQRVVAGTLDSLATLTREAAIRSPALLVVGETAALASSLDWFGDAPVAPAPGVAPAAAAA
jgi:uroporphyrin-III C-methyltransferase/precorrin-2 dehydrogenase/sirohydrochlorin ferrochelatase